MKEVCVGLELGVCRQSVSTAASPLSPPQSSHLIQQPLFPEVRGLDPLTWALWRGVNHRQLNSLQEDFRVLGLRKERREEGEGGDGHSLV